MPVSFYLVWIPLSRLVCVVYTWMIILSQWQTSLIFSFLLSNILYVCLFLGVFELFDSLVVVVSLLSCVRLLYNPMDCSPPGSSVHRISQARILEWVAISFSMGSSRLGAQTQVYWLADRFFITEPLGKVLAILN